MFFRDLQMKKDVKNEVSLAEARLPVRLGHRDAQVVFGDPLARQLAASNLGGVSQVRPHEAGPSDVCGVTLFLALRDTSKSTLETVASMLDHLHAPHGSSIRATTGGDPIIFGLYEGLELSVESIVASNPESRKHLTKACTEAMKGFAISRGWAERADRTIFYFYGDSFRRMQETLISLLEADPAFATAESRQLV